MLAQLNPALTRLTLYALISAIELDLRSSLRSRVLINLEENTVFGTDERSKLEGRRAKSERSPSEIVTDDELLDFLDISDYPEIALRFKDVLDQRLVSAYQTIKTKVVALIPVRNRVMHSRPLDEMDFPTSYELARTLLLVEGIDWIALSRTIKELQEEPEYVLRLRIPEVPWERDLEIPHNLPLPEFDDTGFVGRSKDKDDITKLIWGHHQIVTIIGEGGVGKTAILVKSLYDILDTARDRFDAIVWVSLKNQVLTSAGIQTLKTSLNSMLGLIRGIAENLAPGMDLSTASGIQEILEYMKEFRILLAIDNLETLQGSEIRDFLRDIPEKSKVVITSRVGLGELEIRRPLQPMDEKEAASLFRRFAQIHGVQSLVKMSQEDVVKICKKLYRNPLIIRWFVSSVQSGMSVQIPNEKQAVFLDYCVSNVYGKLSQPAQLLLKVLYAARSFLGDAELAYVSSMVPVEVRKYIYEISSTMMIRSEQHKLSDGSLETRYGLTEIARKFLEVHQRPTQDEVKKIGKKLSELVSAVEEVGGHVHENPYDPRAITVRGPNDRVAARLLLRALAESRQRQFAQAIDLVNQAKEYSPTYPDVFKISAFIRVAAGDYLGAGEDYESALQFSPDSSHVLYFYAGYLLRYMNDTRSALEQISRCAKLDPDNRDVKARHAQTLMYLREYEAADSMFEGLLGQIHQYRSRDKVRLVGMAADCRRRWIEDLNAKKEFGRAWELSVQAFQRFETAFALDSRDERFIETCCELLSDLTRTVRNLATPREPATILVEKFLKFFVYLLDDPRFIRLVEKVRALCQHVQMDISLIRHCQEVADRVGVAWTEKLMQGTILRLNFDRGMGFISDDENPEREHFFSFSQITGRTRPHRIAVGDRFQYVLGQNYMGECAVALEPLY